MLSEKTLWYLKNVVQDKGIVFENKYRMEKCKAPCGRCAFAIAKDYPYETVWGKIYHCTKWVKPHKNWCAEYVNKKYSINASRINNTAKG